MWHHYFTWNSRLGETTAHLIGYTGNQFVFFVLNPWFLLGICLGLYKLATGSNPSCSKKDIILYGFTLMLFFSCAGCGFGQLFWFSGSINWSWPLLSVVWLGVFLRRILENPNSQPSKLSYAAIIVLGFLSGWYAESVSPILILLSIIIWYKYRRFPISSLLIVSIIALIAGTIILSIGIIHTKRLESYPWGFSWLQPFTWKLFLGNTYPLWIFTIIIAWQLRTNWHLLNSGTREKIKKEALSCLLLFLIATIPLGVLRLAGLPRSCMFPSIIVIFLIISTLYKIQETFSFKQKIVQYSVLSILSLSFFLINLDLMQLDNLYYKKIIAEIQLQKNNGITDVFISPPPTHFPSSLGHFNMFLFRFKDRQLLSRDPEFWTNQIIAFYFEVHSVRELDSSQLPASS